MGRTPREDVKIEKRRQQVGDLYVQGSTQAQIARELGITQSTISVDLKAIRREWHESRVRNFDEAVAIAEKKLDYVEHEAVAAWKCSQEAAVTTKATQEGSSNETVKYEKVIKKQSGDPRFLEVQHRCIASRLKLFSPESRSP